MAAVIDRSRSIDDAYGDLLKRDRELTLRDESGESQCVHCYRRKKEHLADGRCTTWVCSRSFTSIDAAEHEKTRRALVLIEQLVQL